MSSRVPAGLPVVAVLVCLIVALGYQAWHLSWPADEPSHFAAGYAYWLGKDYLEPSDVPPLTRLLSGWVPLALGAPRPESTPAWPSKGAYMIGANIIRALPAEQAQRLIFASRRAGRMRRR